MPTIPSPPSVERSADTPPDASLLAEILGVAGAVRRRWAWVALATAAALAAAVLFLMAVTPRYLATAQLLIDPRAKRIVEGAVVPGGFGSSAAGADTLLVDSQVELIQSNTVLKKIVESERLHEDAEFAVPRSGGGIRILLRNTIGRVLFGNERESPPATDPVDTAVWRFADKHLRVRRPGNTYVINVSVMSQDPAKAARLANAVANAYINDQVRATGDTTRDATAALQSRIEDLRKRVETAESAVEAFRTQAGLIGGPNLLVTEQQLQQTNDKLILARSQTALAKARYDQVSGLSARAGSAVLAAQSDALKSPVIANLRASLSRVERREAIAQQSLRPGHPEYANVLVEKRALLAQIDEELARIKANARSELELAQSNEQALAGELKSLETRTAAGNQAQVRLRELQREAQAARAIFEQFLNRAKETSEQETLGRENSRIISAATVPPYPAFPPTLLILAGALLAGLVAGIGTAWLAHLLSGPADAAAAAIPASAPPTPPAPEPPSAAPRRRLRKLLAPLAQPKPMNPPPRVPTADNADAAPIIATTVPGNGGTAVIETLARLPAIGKYPPARPGAGTADGPTFSDHIAAVDDASATAYPGYREVIDQILAKLPARGRRRRQADHLSAGRHGSGRRHLEHRTRTDLPLRDQGAPHAADRRLRVRSAPEPGVRRQSQAAPCLRARQRGASGRDHAAGRAHRPVDVADCACRPRPLRWRAAAAPAGRPASADAALRAGGHRRRRRRRQSGDGVPGRDRRPGVDRHPAVVRVIGPVATAGDGGRPALPGARRRIDRRNRSRVSP